MRVLMTGDTVGGVWTYAVDLADALAGAGVEVHVATMGRLPDAEQRASIEHLYASSYRLEWDDDPWEDVHRAGAWLLELAGELRPDLVHLNGFAHGCLPWATPVVVVAHSDVVSWWWAVHGEAPPERYDRYRGAVEAGLGAADCVVAPTQSVLDDLHRHYRFARPGAVVANGRSAKGRPTRKAPFVLGLGRFWDSAKNVAALERTRALTQWPIIVAGEGTPLGRVPPSVVSLLLARAAIFASPALYEPFGLTILEAALAGCALVLGDIPSLREVWDDAAAFAPAGDPEAFASALRGIESDEALRLNLAQRAQQRAVRYTPEQMRDGYLRLYDGAVAAVAP
jgi:glycosyltransferase involved in cell wall biosynthesis